MKTNRNILKTAGILILGILLGWLIFGGKDTEDDAPQDHAGIDEETIWTCSMHPEIRRNEPGDCPICGMDLIPLDEEDAATDPDVYRMSENAMKLANITTMTVGKSEASREVRLNGKVEVDERNSYTQSTHIPGRIEDLRVNFTGERVNRGQTLAVVYSPNLVTAQEELLQAAEIRESQPELFEAAKEKLRNWKIGENQIDQIMNNERPIEHFPITADINGIVTKKIVDLGDYVERGMPIFEISDLSEVWILFDLYESQVGWVNEGSTVEFQVRSLPGETFEGEITFIDPLLDSQTRVATARVEVNNEDGRLKPEMFVSGTVENDIGEAGSSEIVIPKSAVLWTGRRSLVYLKEDAENGADFRLKEISLGPSLGDAYVVEEGLSAGQEIVVNGTFTVDAAVQLAGKPSMMNPRDEKTREEVLPSLSPADRLDFEISEEAKADLEKLIYNYLEIKDALVADDFDDAEGLVDLIEDQLQEMEDLNLEEEAANAWRNYKIQLEKELSRLTSANDIAEQREVFDEFSAVVIRIAEAFDPVDQKLYVQHCPMADNDQGADWLSLSEEIRNPYYGEAMLTCGEVIEILE